MNTQSELATLRAQLAASEASRKELREALIERVIGMREAAYTYGMNCEEAVRVALDGVLDAIDEAALANDAEQKGVVVKLSAALPPGEALVMQDGKVVGRITNIGAADQPKDVEARG